MAYAAKIYTHKNKDFNPRYCPVIQCYDVCLHGSRLLDEGSALMEILKCSTPRARNRPGKEERNDNEQNSSSSKRHSAEARHTMLAKKHTPKTARSIQNMINVRELLGIYLGDTKQIF